MSHNKNEHGGRKRLFRIVAVGAVIGTIVSQGGKIKRFAQDNSGKLPGIVRNRLKRR